MKINFLGLDREYKDLKREFDIAIKSVLESGHFILGNNVKSFEEEFAEYIGVSHVIGVASGSDALLLALMALEIGPGDEVITTSHTFFATASPIARLGAKIVFTDVGNDSLLDINKIETLINEKTKAVIFVHLYGLAGDLKKLRDLCDKYNIYLLEDCAQAIGAEFKNKKVGSIGDIGCFSFYPTKNLGAFGDGGAITTNNPELADKLYMLRVHGAKPKYYHKIIGINSRLDEIQAAILRIKLKYLDIWNDKRIKIASKYSNVLNKYFKVPIEYKDQKNVYHLYILEHPQRDIIITKLKQWGIATGIYYPLPLHLQECFKYLGYKEGDLPICERKCKENFAIPIYPELTENEIEFVIDKLLDIVKNLEKHEK